MAQTINIEESTPLPLLTLSPPQNQPQITTLNTQQRAKRYDGMELNGKESILVIKDWQVEETVRKAVQNHHEDIKLIKVEK